jgi:UDP-N-acetylglucosamine transferase subunit ALG13
VSEAESGQASSPPVFVTVGTDHHPFDRLVGWIDEWASGRRDGAEVFVQFGTSTPPKAASGSDYVGHDEMEDRIDSAAAIVCHGGPGTIVDCLRSGTKPIVVPRRHALGEHVDDHQVRFARRLEAAGYIHVADGPEKLAQLLDRALSGSEDFVARPTADKIQATVARFGEVTAELLPARPDLRVLYVGGWGRSGSTLLDRLLGQVPGCFSIGEMRDIWLRGLIENRKCGCGEPFDRCPFWTEVGKAAFGGWRLDQAAELHRLRMRFDRPWMVPLLALRRPQVAGLSRYVEATERLYAAIRDVSGAEVIVDSTKIPSYALVLRRIERIDLRFVHLVRDPRGVVHSWKKSVARPDAVGRPDRMIRYGTASASGRYLLYNWTAGLLRASRTPYRFLRYEDLVSDPRGHLERVLAFVGLERQGLEFLNDGTAVLGANHSVDGNPMRFTTGELTIRADEEWRRLLDRRDQRIVSTIAGPLLRRYGYR